MLFFHCLQAFYRTVGKRLRYRDLPYNEVLSPSYLVMKVKQLADKCSLCILLPCTPRQKWFSRIILHLQAKHDRGSFKSQFSCIHEEGSSKLFEVASPTLKNMFLVSFWDRLNLYFWTFWRNIMQIVILENKCNKRPKCFYKLISKDQLINSNI